VVTAIQYAADLLEALKNSDTKTILKNIILPYSAIKISANPNPPYSTLNPDTSSDSPSEKSKGVRLVSAREDTNHIPIRGLKIKTLVHTLFIEAISSRLNLSLKPR